MNSCALFHISKLSLTKKIKLMKNLYVFALMAISIVTYFSLTSGIERSSGSPGGKTGSPGDNGSTCTQCHTGTPSQMDDLISSDIPNNGFIPGETYTITAELTDDEAALIGFELTAEDNQGNKTGSFVITNSAETQYTNSEDAVTHTSDGIQPSGNTNSWSVEWTAPEEPDSEVTFYAAFNAANGDGTNTGDNIYTSQMTADISSVGIAETEPVVKMYPNPVKSVLKVKFTSPELRTIQIMNIQGAVVKYIETEAKEISIPVSDFNKGVYFLKEGESSLKRFIVL